MEDDFENYGEVVSPLYFAIVARIHARVPYSFSGWMVVHFKSVRLERMSMILKFWLRWWVQH